MLHSLTRLDQRVLEKPGRVLFYTAKAGQGGSYLEVFTVAPGFVAQGDTLLNHPLNGWRKSNAALNRYNGHLSF